MKNISLMRQQRNPYQFITRKAVVDIKIPDLSYKN